jgi:hypothetical protein
MTVWQELDAYLGQEFSIDHWSDEAILYAFALIRKMIPADWEALSSAWQLRPKAWQARCAEVLSHADPPQAIPVLLDMIQTPDDELAMTAADSLRALYADAPSVRVSPQVMARLQALTHEHPGLVAQTINKLLACLRVTT